MASRAESVRRYLRTLLPFAWGTAILLGVARPAFGVVAAGSYCVVGTGATSGNSADGWVAVVTPAGAVTVVVNGAPFVNPNDCAIDGNGDIALRFNTNGMYRGYVDPNGKFVVEIYR